MRRVALVLAALVVSGCAIPPPPDSTPQLFSAAAPSPQQVRVYPFPATRTWDAVVQVVTNNQYPILAMEKESGLLVTDWTLVNTTLPETRGHAGGVINSIADLPPVKSLFGEIGIWSQCRYKLNLTTVAVGADSTRVQIVPHIEGWEENQRKAWIPCESKGLLESQFFTALEAELK